MLGVIARQRDLNDDGIVHPHYGDLGFLFCPGRATASLFVCIGVELAGGSTGAPVPRLRFVRSEDGPLLFRRKVAEYLELVSSRRLSRCHSREYQRSCDCEECHTALSKDYVHVGTSLSVLHGVLQFLAQLQKAECAPGIAGATGFCFSWPSCTPIS